MSNVTTLRCKDCGKVREGDITGGCPECGSMWVKVADRGARYGGSDAE